MKILWTSNYFFPEVAQIMGQPPPVFGGWMLALAEDIVQSGAQLAVAALYKGSQVKKIEGDKITYYLLPGLVKSRYVYDRALQKHWAHVLRDFAPDCIHIHGTEYSYGLPLVEVAGDIPVVVSIQGMISVYERYFYAGIGLGTALRYRTLGDSIRFTGIIEGHNRFKARSKFERKILLDVKHVMGRTGWDYANTRAINHDIHYHKCNESLRTPFYAGGWDIDNIERHSIFASQGAYPVKGLHLLLEALWVLKRDIPDVKLTVSGPNITDRSGWKKRLNFTGYGKYIAHLIKKYSLEANVSFTGPLGAAEMAARMAKAHLFTLNSSIENSPNSLGEAQLVGTPCVAAYVGGVPDMVADGVDGLLYNWNEPTILADKLKAVFEDDALAVRLSQHGRKRALERHDRQKNLAAVLETYQEIVRK